MKIEINKIYHDDIFNVMKKIPNKTIDLVYSDPDYNVDISYNGKKYKKKFEEYIEWYINLASESFRVLKDDGNIFFINYPKQNSYLRVKYLDSISFVNEYVWIYNTNIGQTKNRFTTAHRTILHVTKTKNNKWYKNQVVEEYKNPKDKRIMKLMEIDSDADSIDDHPDEYIFRHINKTHKEKAITNNVGRMPYDWMYYDLVKNISRDKTIHPCQIPDGLVRKLFGASTKRGDLILIHFGGSGGEILVAKEMGRNWISADLVKLYVDMIDYRLDHNMKYIDIDDATLIEILKSGSIIDWINK